MTDNSEIIINAAQEAMNAKMQELGFDITNKKLMGDVVNNPMSIIYACESVDNLKNQLLELGDSITLTSITPEIAKKIGDNYTQYTSSSGNTLFDAQEQVMPGFMQFYKGLRKELIRIGLEAAIAALSPKPEIETAGQEIKPDKNELGRG